MLISAEKSKYHKYAFEFNFTMEVLEFCRWLKKEVGWENFGYENRKWRFTDLEIIKFIREKYPQVVMDVSMYEPVTQHKIKQEQDKLQQEKAEQIRQKTESSIEIKGLKMEPYPYQKIGVEFFINNNGKAILADTMGLGKTVQSLGYVVHQKIPKTLVICPASLKFNWEDEISKWTYLHPQVIHNKTPPTIQDVNEHDIFIINYDIVKKYFDFLSSIRFDCLICDEFHYIKNSRAQRTKAVKAIATRIPSILLLSGTPLLSRPEELFNGLQLMDPDVWNNWFAYVKRYCGAIQDGFGLNVNGASNIDELQQRIRRYFLRRNKEDVLPELPPKQFIDIPVQLSPEKRFEYDLAEDDLANFLKEVKNKTDDEASKSMNAEVLVQLNALRQITTQGKIDAAIETITNIVDSGQKVVVFSCYNEPLEKLERIFKGQTAKITGKTQVNLRKAQKDSFQNDPNIKIFLGGIKSAGVGLTLTAASNVLFIDYSWLPSDHAQASDRIHRIGQTASSVSIYQLFARNTIDHKMTKILGNKQALFDKLIDNKDMVIPQAGSQSLVSILIKQIKAGQKK